MGDSFDAWVTNLVFNEKIQVQVEKIFISSWFRYSQVVDLQGIKSGDVFRLTDPVIHCKDVTRFGKTNLAENGMKRFFKTHSCNEICAAMDLPVFVGRDSREKWARVGVRQSDRAENRNDVSISLVYLDEFVDSITKKVGAKCYTSSKKNKWFYPFYCIRLKVLYMIPRLGSHF